MSALFIIEFGLERIKTVVALVEFEISSPILSCVNKNIKFWP